MRWYMTVMADLKGTDTCRLKSGLRQVKERWYVVVEIWDNEDCSGIPLDERFGPTGGLPTKDEALEYYHEKVRPITEKLIAEAEKEGVEVQRLITSTLH